MDVLYDHLNRLERLSKSSQFHLIARVDCQTRLVHVLHRISTNDNFGIPLGTKRGRLLANVLILGTAVELFGGESLQAARASFDSTQRRGTRTWCGWVRAARRTCPLLSQIKTSRWSDVAKHYSTMVTSVERDARAAPSSNCCHAFVVTTANELMTSDETYESGWICDRCHSECDDTSTPFSHCETCSLDVCELCSKDAESSRVGHD